MHTDKTVFVDTWAWLALANRRDIHNNSAREEYRRLKAAECKFVTSDYVLDEVITVLFRNVDFNGAAQFVGSLIEAIDADIIKLECITGSRFKKAWNLRKKYRDKPEISFTDLTSFVVMQELGIVKVFTGDSHFEKVNMGFKRIP